MVLFIDISQMCHNRKYRLESNVKCLSKQNMALRVTLNDRILNFQRPGFQM